MLVSDLSFVVYAKGTIISLLICNLRSTKIFENHSICSVNSLQVRKFTGTNLITVTEISLFSSSCEV